MLVYDVSDIDSFAKVKQWVKELHMMVGQTIALVICANKIDLKTKVVDIEKAESFVALAPGC